MKICIHFLARFLCVGLIFTSAHSLANSNDLSGKVVGGVDASGGEFPFIVSLQDERGHFCGGSLIRKNWVLTAAHCTGLSIKKVVIGLYDRTDLSNTESFTPKRVIVHPKYNANLTDYDFALIELRGDSRFQPIALNTTEIRIPNTPTLMATVIGWGSTKENSSILPTVMQKANVPLVPRGLCNRSYSGMITERMLCAGYANGGKDACQGDSGGPLVMNMTQSRRLLVGVVSWGEGCAEANRPGIYSKVNKAVSWIEKTLTNTDPL
ncbi:MAG TPA: serine protease [Pseudobdellovibrionaceae bacterium]|jgi:trypsin